MRNNINFDKITLGTCYYPEHWDKSMWEDDLNRMAEHGIEIIRIAEFAWNKFEPHEGEYAFEFFDEFMNHAREKNMKVIMGTPTATPPAWMSEKYPEILNADIDGNLIHHGMRRQHNMNSPVYREFTAKIVDKMAAHYSHYENLIGWQIDNEINCECDRYYSESDHKAFREYLKNKFKTLDNLNEQMGTVFWNQTYTDWNEIHLTRRANSLGNSNPHMQLEESRFISETAIGYMKLQADIIRKYKRDDQFITTNGIFGNVDYQRLTDEVLDFLTYDSYPNFYFGVDVDPEKGNGFSDRNQSRVLTEIRSFSNTFGIMEQQSGGGGWNCWLPQVMPKPGQMRLWTMQSIAHGADYISYFRWRTAAFGTEIYWFGLNDWQNRDNRRLRELKQIKSDIDKMAEITGAEYAADVLILQDYDNAWDRDEWHKMCERVSSNAWFMYLQKNHIPYDTLYLTDKTSYDEIKKYKHIIYAHPSIMTEARVKLLTGYVENGGKLILGARAGVKKINAQCDTRTLPAGLTDLVGAYVDEFTPLSKFDDTEYIVTDTEKASAPVFNEVLKLNGGKIIARYENNYYDGEIAAVSKQTGNGTAYYYGCVFGEDTAALAAKTAGISAPYSDLLDLPEEIELAVRKSENTEYIFLLNYGKNPVEINVRKPLQDMLENETIFEKYCIHGYGCAVLKNVF